MLTRPQLLPTLVLGIAMLTAGCARGPASFADIIAANPADYDSYLFKLTYMGPQDRVLKTVVFGSATPRNAALFTPYRRAGYRYANDDRSDVIDFAMNGSEVSAVVTAMSGDAVFTNNAARPTPVLSLMIMRDAGGRDEKVFETLVQFPDANRLVKDIIGGNLDAGNALGAKYIRYWSKNVGG